MQLDAIEKLLERPVEPGQIEVRWIFQVKCGAGAPEFGTEVWGDRVRVTDVAPSGMDRLALAKKIIPLFGAHILESFLAAMGAKRRPDSRGLEELGVVTRVKEFSDAA